MSIWNYLNDIELQQLKDCHRAIHDANSVAAEIAARTADAESELRKAQKSESEQQTFAVARAMGDDMVEPEPIEVDVAELESLIAGLKNKEAGQQSVITTNTHAYEMAVKQILRTCLERAAETYHTQAQELIQTWNELNDAQLALGDRELSWINIFLPALDGMNGGEMNYGRLALFNGKDTPIEQRAEAELQLLLKV